MEEGRGGECAHLEDKWRRQKKLEKAVKGAGREWGGFVHRQKNVRTVSRVGFVLVLSSSSVHAKRKREYTHIHAFNSEMVRLFPLRKTILKRE